MKHADFTTLFSLVAGTLGTPEKGPVVQHLDSCARCSTEAKTAEQLFRTVSADRMVAPPEDLVARAIALWKKERPGRVRRAVTAIRAVLAFDSFASPLPAAVRSGRLSNQTARTRRMLFTAGQYDIDLAVERSAAPRGRPSLRGQVLRRAASGLPKGTEATLVRSAGKSTRLPLDDDGAFSTGPLVPGRYHLTLVADEVRIVIQRLDLN